MSGSVEQVKENRQLICGMPKDLFVNTTPWQSKTRECPRCTQTRAYYPEGKRRCLKCGELFLVGCKLSRICSACYELNRHDRYAEAI